MTINYCEPNWEVEYRDAEGGSVIRIKVAALDRQEAISTASGKLNAAQVKPKRALYFQTANQLPAPVSAS